MRSGTAIIWLTLSMVLGSPADAAIAQIAGEWTTEYQIVDVSNSTITDPATLQALRTWISHKYGSRNCVNKDDPSNLLQSAYPWDPRVKPIVKFSDYGAFSATNRYFGGFAIPGHGTETVVGVIDGDHLRGVVDIDLDWEGGTHVRSVLTATRSGAC